MFGIGPMELVVIAIVALLVMGPERLPELMQKAGHFFVKARRYSSDLRGEFDLAVRAAEREMRVLETERLKNQFKEVLNSPQENRSLDIEGTKKEEDLVTEIVGAVAHTQEVVLEKKDHHFFEAPLPLGSQSIDGNKN